MDESIVRGRTLTEQVYHLIRQSILTGDLKPGERIVETRLAEYYQTSRSPVREAIQLLCAERLLEKKNEAIWVVIPSLDELRQVSELRLAIESMTTELAAKRMTSSDLEQLGQLVNTDVNENVQQEVHDESKNDFHFHRFIASFSRNNRLQNILDDIFSQIRMYSQFMAQPARVPRIHTSHAEIYGHLLRGDGAAAGETMRDHIRQSMEGLESSSFGNWEMKSPG